MKKHPLSLVVASVVLMLVALPGLAIAQEEEPAEYAAPSMEEMMAAMMEAGMPGEMHELLQRTVGTWNFTLKMYMDPANPMEMTGTSKTEAIMDGRFVAEHVESEFMGQPFRGMGLTGYDNVSGEFQAIWIDNMTTTLYTYTGELEGDAIVMTGIHVDPMSGEEVPQRSVLTFVDDDHMLVENYETRDGEERLTMELHYTRAPGSGM